MASYLYVVILLYVIFSLNYCKNKLKVKEFYVDSPLNRRAHPPIEPVKRRSKFIDFHTKTKLTRGERTMKNPFLTGSIGSY
jgi:hypothetical protein